ncbi:hypothetical protein [Amycolatopsis anabasis]|uniref:hypothetical protein n=1 Tax=Amycolatopsis anabasis TaxID=1840409 RepID=UPI00131AE3FC|nr:hypothetical protein [Amycolatopsis anabasis]
MQDELRLFHAHPDMLTGGTMPEYLFRRTSGVVGLLERPIEEAAPRLSIPASSSDQRLDVLLAHRDDILTDCSAVVAPVHVGSFTEQAAFLDHCFPPRPAGGQVGGRGHGSMTEHMHVHYRRHELQFVDTRFIRSKNNLPRIKLTPSGDFSEHHLSRSVTS